MKIKQRVIASATLVIRIAFIQLVLLGCIASSLNAKEGYAQNLLEKRITLNVKNQTLKQVIGLIKKQTNVDFSFSASAIKADRIISYNVSNKTLQDFLIDLNAYNISYRIVNDQIVLFQANTTSGTISETILTEGTQSEMADIEVTGYVYDDTNLPLPGASIIVKGTTIGTSTNDKGFFKIKVPNENAVLVVKSVGFASKEVKVGSQKSFKITLGSAVKALESVVIVGYGTQKKATSTGAQSSISTKDLTQSPVANLSNSLVGRLSGVTGIQASGEPGNDQTTIRIRGISTFAGSQDPLVMVDGIEVSLADFNRIDPNEVENVTILKDASSTAVYGIRGANGVMLVTTKSGKIGPPTISYSYNYALSSFTDIRANMNSYDYANSLNKAKYNLGYINNSINSYVPQWSPEEIEKFQNGSDRYLYPNTDWFDLMFKKSSGQHQHNVNFRGGTKRAKYFISAGYFNQEGLFNNTGIVTGFDNQIKFNRYNFRSNLDFDVTKQFKVALKVFSQTTDKKGPNVPRTETLIDNVFRTNPTASPGVVDGKLVTTVISDNPLTSLLGSGYRQNYSSTINGSLRLDHALGFITKGLTTHAEIAIQNNNEQISSYSLSPLTYKVITDINGESNIVPSGDETPSSFVGASYDKFRRVTAEFALNYQREFNGHTVSGLALYNQQKSFDPAYFDLVPAGYQSVVGRATYDYKHRYLAEFNMAYNGSENFAPGQRFGLFPSYSLGWVPSEESFFPKNNIISFLKIRGSYGEVGNDRIGTNFLESNNRFLYRSTAFTRFEGYFTGLIATTNGANRMGNALGLLQGRTSNPNLTWERAIKSNIGFEAFLFKDKISLTVDVFKDKRDNILATINNVGATLGSLSAPANFGKMENKGFEMDLGYRDHIGNFNYYTKGNFSFARNKILFQDEITRAFPYQYRTGYRFEQVFGLIADGLYNTWEEVNEANRVRHLDQARIQPGDIKYRDINGDGIVNFDDEVPIGYSKTPEVTYGLTLGASYKGIDLSVLFQGASNVSAQYSRRSIEGFMDSPTASAVSTLLESWTPERYAQGLPINYPRFAIGNTGSDRNNYRTSTFYNVDASYLRIKNVELGYTLPASLSKKIKLKSARFYLTANNLYTWTKLLDGIDPENPNLGANFEAYPLTRTVNFGTNINF